MRLLLAAAIVLTLPPPIGAIQARSFAPPKAQLPAAPAVAAAIPALPISAALRTVAVDPQTAAPGPRIATIAVAQSFAAVAPEKADFSRFAAYDHAAPGQAPSEVTGLPAVSVPSSRLTAPEVSWRRAWRHKYRGWRGKTVFEVPLTASDHRSLIKIAFVAIPLSFELMAIAIGLTSPSVPAQKWVFAIGAALFMGLLAALTQIPPHMTEYEDGKAVRRNAKRYNENPSVSRADPELLEKARRFEGETGWRILWTDRPDMLAQADEEARSVTMSIGWVVASSNDKDRRRLAYLTEVLRIVRHAAEKQRLTPR